MRRAFKITLIAGVIAAIGGVIIIAGKALWDKGNAIGGPPASAPPPSVPVAEVLSRPLTPTTEFTGFSGRAGDRGTTFARGAEFLRP
ncbi:cation transport poprotein [Salmonella bongori]|nr:cation transport poprotein [Salmonella bongori]